MSMKWPAACVAAIAAACPHAGHAQTATTPDTSAAGAARTLGDVPAAPGAPWQPLSTKGVTLTLTYTGEAATNVTGGLRRDAAYAGQVFAGVDADMDRIAGIPGATIHVAVTNRHGASLSAIAIGNNTSVQEIYGTQNTHLALLTWQQKLLNDRLEFEVGRSVSNVAFTTSPYYCAFQTNAVCGNPVFVYFAGNSSGFPASRWSAHATARFTPAVSVHVGAYEVNPDRGARGDHGLDFGIRNATGVYVPFELGYDSGAAGARLPGHYQVGGWVDRSRYDDPLRDDAGGIAILTGNAPARRFGRTGAYIRFDQALTRRAGPSTRGLGIFGVAMASIGGRVPSDRFLELGLLQTGTFAGRDADTIGFVITDQRLSDLAARRLAAARIAAGGSVQKVARHQVMLEMNYGLQVGRALRILPNIQYIIHPDQLSAPFQQRASRDALIAGLRLSIDALALPGLTRTST